MGKEKDDEYKKYINEEIEEIDKKIFQKLSQHIRKEAKKNGNRETKEILSFIKREYPWIIELYPAIKTLEPGFSETHDEN